MANRVLIGNRSSGGYGLYVSRLTSNVLTCANDKLLFNTNSGETGSNFFSAGHFQVVPQSGGVGSTAPVASQTTTISSGSTGTPSYTNIANTQVLAWGSSNVLTSYSGGDSVTAVDQVYTYSSAGTTSITLTNSGTASRTIRTVMFNKFSTAALF